MNWKYVKLFVNAMNSPDTVYGNVPEDQGHGVVMYVLVFSFVVDALFLSRFLLCCVVLSGTNTINRLPPHPH